MKNIITTIALFVGLSLHAQFNLCNLTLTQVSITGSVDFSQGELDLSKICIKVTGTADLCDDEGTVIGSGMTVTVQSVGCKTNRISEQGMSSDQLFIPFELLGDSPEFEGKEIPYVFPNPSQGLYTLKTEDTNIEDIIQVLSMSNGKALDLNIIKTTNGYSVDLSSYPSGMYLLRYKKGEFEFSQKIIKN